MPVNKAHFEFSALDLKCANWTLPEGYAEGALAEEWILSGALDHQAKSGSRTRLLRFRPGFKTYEPFTHDYWEEVFLLEGDMTVGAAGRGDTVQRFEGYTYAVRPPGVPHGPFASDQGALLLEIHYFDPA